MPIHGDGENISDWLHVSDHCRAIETLLLCACPGSRYVIGSGSEMTNLEVARAILDVTHQVLPGKTRLTDEEAIEFLPEKRGDDRRHSINYGAMSRDFGWKPIKDFCTGLHETVTWYVENQAWCQEFEDTDSGQGLGII